MSSIAIAVACQDLDIRSVRALVIGPPTSPYEYGFFEFSVKFTSDYPSKPPKVDARTTNGGRCRFNPNIYAAGKVCLSILGTWHGEKPGEEWSSAQGLESILWSIQSLMSNNPYENEPGYENAKTPEDKRMNEAYCAKVLGNVCLFLRMPFDFALDPARNSPHSCHSENGRHPVHS